VPHGREADEDDHLLRVRRDLALESLASYIVEREVSECDKQCHVARRNYSWGWW
jgi:hypothetical protein